MSRWHSWAEEELEIVRRDFKHSRQSCIDLANRLSKPGDKVTQFAVRGKVQIMGITRDGRQPWDEPQDKRLRLLFGKYPPLRVAKMMKRGVNSVVVRAKRLKIYRRCRDGWYTKAEVCEILGVDHRWVQARIDCGALNASWHGETKPCKNGGSCWHIEEDALKEFIRLYPQDLVGRNVDIIQIIDLLAGIVVKI